VFANQPTGTTEAQVLDSVRAGQGTLQRIDRALFRGTLRGLPRGENTLTIVTFEPSGTHNVQRVTAVLP
jgi:hypothetical protein